MAEAKETKTLDEDVESVKVLLAIVAVSTIDSLVTRRVRDSADSVVEAMLLGEVVVKRGEP